MPALSLVVCLYQQRDLLERLLQNAKGCYDDLVVVHDGPDTTNVRQVVERHGGRFYEHPRIGSVEGQSPFAWAQAAHDWILRIDADEIPDDELKKWIQNFRAAPEPETQVSGYTCISPLWNGQKTISKKWWNGRIFLINRQRVKFFGMPENAPVPDVQFEPLDMRLHNQSNRKSYGFHNVLVRKQAYRWRAVIARSLMGKPTDLPCWRWESETWPLGWEQIRRHPFQTAARRLVMETFRGLRSQWRSDKRFYFEAALNGPIHHVLLCLKFWQVRRQQSPEKARVKKQAIE